MLKPVMLGDLIRVIDRWSLRNSKATPGLSADGKNAEADSIDRSQLNLLKRLSEKHDPELLKNIIVDFLESAPKRIAKLRDAVRDGDVEALGTVAHGLVGVSGNLGLRRMAKLSGKLQSMSHSDSLTGAGEVIGEIEEELVLVKPQLEAQYLDQRAAHNA